MASAATMSNEKRGTLPGGISFFACRISTGTNGEDGVYAITDLAKVEGAAVTSAESGKTAAFGWVPNSSYPERVTVHAPAGATGDEADVDILAWGYR